MYRAGADHRRTGWIQSYPPPSSPQLPTCTSNFEVMINFTVLWIMSKWIVRAKIDKESLYYTATMGRYFPHFAPIDSLLHLARLHAWNKMYNGKLNHLLYACASTYSYLCLHDTPYPGSTVHNCFIQNIWFLYNMSYMVSNFSWQLSMTWMSKRDKTKQNMNVNLDLSKDSLILH